MKFKKILALCLITCATLSSTMVASADAKDSTLPTDYISSTKCTFSNWRYKDNYTSHYINNTCALRLRVISYSSSNNNRTCRGSAVIPGNCERFIKNTVREAYRDGEEGNTLCRLYIRADISGSSARLSGKWSPDSVGSYPVANP